MTQSSQNQSISKSDPYRAAFDRASAGSVEPAWLATGRKAAIANFTELGFPTLNDEDWRFTNVAPIAALPFKPVLAPAPGGVDAATVDRYSFARLQASRLFFVNGHFSANSPRSCRFRRASKLAASPPRCGATRASLRSTWPGTRRPKTTLSLRSTPRSSATARSLAFPPA